MVAGGYRVLEKDTTDYNSLGGVTRGFRMLQRDYKSLQWVTWR